MGAETKAVQGELTYLLVVMQAFDIVLGQELALRRLLCAIVLHALGKILSSSM